MGRAPEALRPADYLILEALARRPMSTGEITRVTGCSHPKVLERLKKFEANNLVIRGKSNKWCAAMVVWVAPVAEVAEKISGEKVLKMSPSLPELLEPEIRQGKPVENAESLPEAAQTPRKAVPDLAPPKKAATPYKPPAPPKHAKISDKARAISERLNVPDYLDGRGEVSTGKVVRCELCASKTTILRYGVDPLCPMCARGGV